MTSDGIVYHSIHGFVHHTHGFVYHRALLKVRFRYTSWHIVLCVNDPVVKFNHASHKPVVLTTQGVTRFEDEPGETYTSTTTVQFLWLVERLRGCVPSTMFEICTGFSSIRPSNIGGRCEVVTQPSVVDVCHARSCMNRGRSSPIVDIGSCTNVVPDLRRSDS